MHASFLAFNLYFNLIKWPPHYYDQFYTDLMMEFVLGFYSICRCRLLVSALLPQWWSICLKCLRLQVWYQPHHATDIQKTHRSRSAVWPLPSYLCGSGFHQEEGCPKCRLWELVSHHFILKSKANNTHSPVISFILILQWFNKVFLTHVLLVMPWLNQMMILHKTHFTNLFC